jgi:Electron transfer DM13
VQLAGPMKTFLRNYRLSIPSGIVLVAVLAWVIFGYFGAHLLFVDDEVNEAVPTFSEPIAVPATVPETTVLETTVPETTVSATVVTPTTVPTTTVPATVPATAPPTTVPPEPAIVTEASGSFVSRSHDTSGQAIVLGDGSGQRFLRFEDFETSNGPDVNVYLVNSSTGDVSDFIDLGNLKGNIGAQNYEIPVGVDLAVYDTVIVWCVRFAENFGDAVLTPA